eukprot:Nk52_evm77s217 gene=Nk52_evmTU77s217
MSAVEEQQNASHDENVDGGLVEMDVCCPECGFMKSANGEKVEKSCKCTSVQNDAMTIAFNDLSYSVDVELGTESVGATVLKSFGLKRRHFERKTILRNVNGAIRPGTMTALMGPSGAGKSTLLDVLADRKEEGFIEGELLFNGSELPADFRRISSYVEQQDILHPNLTPRELLYYTAQFRLPDTMTEEMKVERVNEVLSQLGLTKCADTVIGGRLRRGISGGQAKRVNIAMELITNPSIIFLDEPTSGLDSKTSYEVMKVVRKLTNAGRSVICTIHQPSPQVFNMFDRLLLLVKGEPVYNGSVKESIAYFESFGFELPEDMNPADFILAVAGSGVGSTGISKSMIKGPEVEEGFFATEYLKSQLYDERLKSVKQASEIPDRRQSCVGEGKRLRKEAEHFASGMVHSTITLMKRSWKGHMRDPYFFSTRLYQNIIIALIMLSIYHTLGYDANGIQNRVNFLFFLVTIFGMAAFKYLNSMFEERELFIRERQAGTYRVSSYFFHLWFVEVPLATLSALLFCLIVYWGADFRPGFTHFLIFFVVVFLTQEIGIAYAAGFAAMSPNFEVAASMSAIVLTIFMLFSGYLVAESSIGPWWIWAYHLSFFKYAIHALGYNEFHENERFVKPNWQSVMAQYDFDDVALVWDFLFLIAMVIFFRACCYLALRFKRHKH